MTFPNKKITKGWLMNYEEEDGWEDLGQIDSMSREEDGWISYKVIHGICGTVVNIGKENNEIFRFCPRCLRKVEND